MIGRIPYKWLVAAVYVLGIFMNLLDLTITNVALPVMARGFGVSAASIAWVATSYLLSVAVCIPVSGWIGDRFGTKRAFVCALAIFTVGSLLCGVVQGLGPLIVCRILQGIGGGLLTPVGAAMVFGHFRLRSVRASPRSSPSRQSWHPLWPSDRWLPGAILDMACDLSDQRTDWRSGPDRRDDWVARAPR